MSDFAQSIVIETEAGLEVVEVGIQGPAGPQGAPGLGGDASVISYIAAIPLSGHRMVRLNASSQLVYAGADVLADANLVLGMTNGAVSTGSPATVIRSGEITEPTWNWTVGNPIYLGSNGFLTQTPPSFPTSKFSQIVGFAMSATKAFISIREPIILS